MGKKRVFTKMTPADSERQPALRIQFKGKDQIDYLALYKFASEDFDNMSGTTLARLIICDWVRAFREKKAKGGASAQQMVMILTGKKTSAKSAEAKA